MYIIHNIPTPKKEYTVCCPQARKENKKSGCPHIKTSNRHPIGIFWSWWRESNPWPHPYQGCALPSVPHQHAQVIHLSSLHFYAYTTSLPRMCATTCATSAYLAGAEGLEPSARGFGDHCSTNWAIPLYRFPIKMVGLQGFEPGTDRLWAGCSNQLS